MVTNSSDAIRLVETELRLAPTLPESSEKMSLRDRMQMYGVPGLSLAVIHDGRLQWARGFGVRRAGGAEPVTADTLFQAGSISKAVTAVAVVRLADAGELDLDKDVNDYLSSWKVPTNGEWQPRVTLRHLLTHTAGTTVTGLFGYRHGAPLPTVPQILDGLPPSNSRPVRVNAIPGAQFRYSGGGLTIVQQVLMDVRGQPFPELMWKVVLDPLGMERSTFAQPLPASRWKEASAGHWMGPDAVDGGRWYVYPQMAAGGLWSTPSDLARLVLDLQRAWAGRPGTLLSAHGTREMLRPQIVGHWGLGFSLSGQGTTTRFGHQGDTLGFNADMIAYRETGSGAIAMASSITGMTPIGDVFRTLADAYGWPDFSPPRRRPLPAASPSQERQIGEYQLPGGFRLRVLRDGDGLQLQPESQPAMRLYPFGEREYFCRDVHAECVFHPDTAGKVTGLEIVQTDSTVHAARL